MLWRRCRRAGCNSRSGPNSDEPRVRVAAHLARLPRPHAYLRTVANLVGAAAHDRLTLFQRPEHLDQVADAGTTTDVHPLRHAVAHTDDERTLCGRDNARRWDEERWLKPP